MSADAAVRPLPARYQDLEGWAVGGGTGTVRGRRHEGGPMLHFLHGNGLSSGVYWPLLRPLCDGYGLFAQDLEGHGESDSTAAFHGASHFLGRIRGAIEQQLGDRPLVAIGHSYGAALSLRLAHAERQRVGALVLLDPILLPPWQRLLYRLGTRLGFNPMSSGTRKRRYQWPDRESVVQHFQGRGVYANWTPEALRAFADCCLKPAAEGVELSCERALEASIYEHPIPPGRLIAELDIPILVLSGRRSYPFMPAAVRGLQRQNPRIQTQVLDGGHCFMLEQPQPSVEAIRRFLADAGFPPAA